MKNISILLLFAFAGILFIDDLRAANWFKRKEEKKEEVKPEPAEPKKVAPVTPPLEEAKPAPDAPTPVAPAVPADEGSESA